jgi:predicted membrane channel-forming protein YqfA (hemolysin III family)
VAGVLTTEKKTEESRVELRRYKERLEIIGLIAMGVGMVFLVRPLTLVLFSLGFPILLVGLIFYIVVSHF